MCFAKYIFHLQTWKSYESKFCNDFGCLLIEFVNLTRVSKLSITNFLNKFTGLIGGSLPSAFLHTTLIRRSEKNVVYYEVLEITRLIMVTLCTEIQAQEVELSDVFEMRCP